VNFKRLRAAEYARNTSGAALRDGQVVLPQPDDGPACGAEAAFDIVVAFSVAAELGEPVCTIAARLAAVLWATVPETAVNEDGKALAPKDEIGTAWQRLMAAPAGDAGGTKDGRELKFGVFIAARADGCHDLAALCLCEYVGHEESLCLRGDEVAEWSVRVGDGEGLFGTGAAAVEGLAELALARHGAFLDYSREQGGDDGVYVASKRFPMVSVTHSVAFRFVPRSRLVIGDIYIRRRRPWRSGSGGGSAGVVRVWEVGVDSEGIQGAALAVAQPIQFRW
jgi:hypothetical protein